MLGNQRGGFTIIEVMLFLGLSSLLLAGIMAGVSAQVQSQQYRQGVQEIRSAITGEFEAVYNLSNQRTGPDPCGGRTTTPGTSDCYYVGRLLQFGSAPDGAMSLDAWPVVARPRPGNQYVRVLRTPSSPRSALAGLDGYEVKLAPEQSLRHTYAASWGLRTYAPGSSSASPHITSALLILRSPVDGAVRSYKLSGRSAIFAAGGSPRDLTTLTATGPQAQAVDDKTVACIGMPRGTLWPGGVLAIRIAGLATGPGDVEIIPSADLEQQEGKQCHKW